MDIPIFSDFSDTIAQSSDRKKFPPFEKELAILVAKDITDENEKRHFLSVCETSYSEFLRAKQNSDKPYEEKMKIWLTPFQNRLSQIHCRKLAESFLINSNFFLILEVFRRQFSIKDLSITIVSGTLQQIIHAFLERPTINEVFNKYNVNFIVEATEIRFNSEGTYNGSVKASSKRVSEGFKAFPQKYFILGDDVMEQYGFNEHLLNIQSYDEYQINSRILHVSDTISS